MVLELLGRRCGSVASFPSVGAMEVIDKSFSAMVAILDTGRDGIHGSQFAARTLMSEMRKTTDLDTVVCAATGDHGKSFGGRILGSVRSSA